MSPVSNKHDTTYIFIKVQLAKDDHPPSWLGTVDPIDTDSARNSASDRQPFKYTLTVSQYFFFSKFSSTLVFRVIHFSFSFLSTRSSLLLTILSAEIVNHLLCYPRTNYFRKQLIANSSFKIYIYVYFF